ncbi:uncharacterized protein [Haliotis cracherodii]|uniref:uncharacterized protein isoform X2 n=1 Tax=Haliotis cracherodii TaxID=6455 RepID=UPI0039E8149C
MDILGPIIFILMAFAFIGNIGLCLIIVTSKRLRQRLRFWFIFGTAVCDVLAGVTLCLCGVQYYVKNRYNCTFLIIQMAFVYFGMELVNLWYLVALNIDFCIRLCRPRLPRLSACGRILLYVTLALLPWAAMVLIVTPGIALGLRDYMNETLQCSFILSLESDIPLKVICCLLPLVVIIGTFIYMVYKPWALSRPGCYVNMTSQLIEDPDEDVIEPRRFFIIPCIVTIVCSAPFQIWKIIPPERLDVGAFYVTESVLILILLSKAAILPYVWLILPSLKAEIKRICLKPQEAGFATYRRFPQQHDSGEVTISHSEDE